MVMTLPSLESASDLESNEPGSVIKVVLDSSFTCLSWGSVSVYQMILIEKVKFKKVDLKTTTTTTTWPVWVIRTDEASGQSVHQPVSCQQGSVSLQAPPMGRLPTLPVVFCVSERLQVLPPSHLTFEGLVPPYRRIFCSCWRVRSDRPHPAEGLISC